jgi:hypothetical protein
MKKQVAKTISTLSLTVLLVTVCAINVPAPCGTCYPPSVKNAASTPAQSTGPTQTLIFWVQLVTFFASPL